MTQRLKGQCPVCLTARAAGCWRKEGDHERNARVGEPLVCLNCGSFLVFESIEGDRANVRAMTDEEVGLLADEVRIGLMRIRREVKEVRPIQPMNCPSCGVDMIGASHLFGKPIMQGPKPGDVGLCGRCAAPLVFGGPGTVRLMSREDWDGTPEHIRARMKDELVRRLHDVMGEIANNLDDAQ